MGDCQNYGPFWGPYYNLGDPKRDHNFDNPPHAWIPAQLPGLLQELGLPTAPGGNMGERIAALVRVVLKVDQGGAAQYLRVRIQLEEQDAQQQANVADVADMDGLAETVDLKEISDSCAFFINSSFIRK